MGGQCKLIKIKDFFKGDFQRVGFQYLWSKMKVNVHSLATYGAAYQSVLTNVQFGSRSGASPITKHLEEYLNHSDKKELSIRFNVDMYDSFGTSANFTYGRIVGSIGIQVTIRRLISHLVVCLNQIIILQIFGFLLLFTTMKRKPSCLTWVIVWLSQRTEIL